MPGGSGARCAAPARCEFPRSGHEMRKSIVMCAGLTLFAAVGAGAQSAANTCPAGGTIGGFPDPVRASQDACQMAVDVFQMMAPQLGLALAGGNATLGRGSAL